MNIDLVYNTAQPRKYPPDSGLVVFWGSVSIKYNHTRQGIVSGIEAIM